MDQFTGLAGRACNVHATDHIPQSIFVICDPFVTTRARYFNAADTNNHGRVAAPLSTSLDHVFNMPNGELFLLCHLVFSTTF